ncbi:MAG TPA: hypothetical protein VI546_02575 [candidate division Zixibacteria bacterium]|nr:hypothetical protein [candidate division Zixibacteria bacterium]
MRWELKRIDLASLAKVALFLNAILGFLIGIPIGFFFYLGSMLPGMEENPIPQGLALFFPFITMFAVAIIKTLAWFIGGLLYNLLARLFGGLELELKETSPKAPPARTSPGSIDFSSL